MRKRALCLILALMMCVTLLPVYGLADDGDIQLPEAPSIDGSGTFSNGTAWTHYTDNSLAIGRYISDGAAATDEVPDYAYLDSCASWSSRTSRSCSQHPASAPART